MSRLRDVAIAPHEDDPSKWELRILTTKWGVVGDRHLKGEANFPASHKMMSLEEAIEARDKWQKFVNAQDERLRRVARKKRR